MYRMHRQELGMLGHSIDSATHLARGEPPGYHDCAGQSATVTRPCSIRVRLADPEAPLRPLHAGDGVAGVRLHAGGADPRGGDCCAPTPGRERTSAIVYAVGWTQHTTGVQMIRTAAILQLLLGNMGRPGGGIMAMRGPCDHPGIDRPADAVRHCCRATCRSRAPRSSTSARLVRPAGGPAHRVLGQLPQVHRQPAQGLVRRRRDAGERLRLLLAAAGRTPTTRSSPTSTGCRRAG